MPTERHPFFLDGLGLLAHLGKSLGYIPQSRALVGASGEQERAILGPRDRQHHLLVPFENSHRCNANRLTRSSGSHDGANIPDPDGVIESAGGQELAAFEEINAIDPI